MIWKQNKKITHENRLCIEPPKVILGGLFFNNNFVLLIYNNIQIWML
jgi:hypothetical protein